MIVRLLQTFDSFQVAQAEAAPPGSLPPAEWKSGKGRETIEQIHPQSAMTLYSKVRHDFQHTHESLADLSTLGRRIRTGRRVAPHAFRCVIDTCLTRTSSQQSLSHKEPRFETINLAVKPLNINLLLQCVGRDRIKGIFGLRDWFGAYRRTGLGLPRTGSSTFQRRMCLI